MNRWRDFQKKASECTYIYIRSKNHKQQKQNNTKQTRTRRRKQTRHTQMSDEQNTRKLFLACHNESDRYIVASFFSLSSLCPCFIFGGWGNVVCVCVCVCVLLLLCTGYVPAWLEVVVRTFLLVLVLLTNKVLIYDDELHNHP